MKKSNKSREALLQKKRTKRNQSRKGKTYNPNKIQNLFGASQTEPDLTDNNTKLVL